MSKVITTNQIKEILNAELAKTRADENYHANILLTGNDGYGRTNVTCKWFEIKGIRYYKFTNPGFGGIAGKEVIDTLPIGTFAVMLKQTDTPALDPDFDTVSQIVATRKLNGTDYSNLKFTVATACYDETVPGTVKLPEAFTGEFEIYEVKPSLKETLEYLSGWLEKKSTNVSRLNVKSVQGGKDLRKITTFRLAQQKKLIADLLAAMGDRDFILRPFFPPRKVEELFEDKAMDTVPEFVSAAVIAMKMAKEAAPEGQKPEIDKAIEEFRGLFQ